MSLQRISCVPASRFRSAVHELRWLLPSVMPLAVPRRSLIQSGYRRPGKPREDKPPWQKIKFDFSKGLEGIKKQFKLLKDEFSGRLVGPEGKPIIEHMLEQNRVVWEFRGPECLQEWTLSCDREIGGQSEIYLKLGRNNETCFLYGTLCSAPPRDGETRYSGYCTMRSKQPLVSARLSAASCSSHFTTWNTSCIILGVVRQEKAPRLEQFQHPPPADSGWRPAMDDQHRSGDLLLSSEGRRLQLLSVHQRRTLLARCKGKEGKLSNKIVMSVIISYASYNFSALEWVEMRRSFLQMAIIRALIFSALNLNTFSTACSALWVQSADCNLTFNNTYVQ